MRAIALSRADDTASQLAADVLAGVGNAYQGRGVLALEHLDAALIQADALGEVWERARINQMRGIALRSRQVDRPREALDAWQRAMADYATAGDTTHVNNVRYMMATDHHRSRASGSRMRCSGPQECVAYATETANRHETRPRADRACRAHHRPGAPTTTSRVATSTFRECGDLRCLDPQSPADGAAGTRAIASSTSSSALRGRRVRRPTTTRG